MKRRNFIKNSVPFVLGGLLPNKLTSVPVFAPKKTIGLQLLTIAPLINQDIKTLLQKVADTGYTEIESTLSENGVFYGLKPKIFAALIKDLGLTWRSHHVMGAPYQTRVGTSPLLVNRSKYLNLKENAQQIIDDAASYGVEYLVCTTIPITGLQDIRESTETLHKAGVLAKKAGLTLCYHNHDKEFQEVDGQKPYDWFLSQINTDILKMQIDVAWAIKAGVDPVALFKKHPKRFPLWHVKDINDSFTTLMPVGEGSIDFKRIFEHTKIAGLKHFFVEHDNPLDPLASITSSYQYLTRIL